MAFCKSLAQQRLQFITSTNLLPFPTWSILWYAKEFNQAKLPWHKKDFSWQWWDYSPKLASKAHWTFKDGLCWATLKVTLSLYPSYWASANTHHRSKLKDCLAKSCLFGTKWPVSSYFLHSPPKWLQQCVFPDLNLQNCNTVNLLLQGKTSYFIYKDISTLYSSSNAVDKTLQRLV